MAMVLKLTDGTTTLDLAATTAYAIPDGEWTPAISKRRRSGLAGPIYEDVEERIPLHVRGATGAAALDNLVALVNLLDQAERFWLGEAVAPVLLQYLPHNTNLRAVVQSEVLGAVGDKTPWLRLSPYVNDASNYELPEIELRILRRGDWLAAVDSISPSGTAQPAITTATFSETVPLYSPVTLKASNVDYENQNGINIPKGLWFVASEATRLKLVEGESFSSTGATTSTCAIVVDANASGGNYAEFDHGEDGYWNLDETAIDGDLIGAFAMCRQTVGSDVWQLTTEIYRQATSGINLSQVVTLVDDGPAYEPVRLGVLSRADDDFTLHIQALRQSGSGKFNIDYLVLIVLGAPGERVIQFNAMTGVLPYTGLPGDIVDRQMAIDSGRLTMTRPRFQLQETSGGALVTTISYDGNIHLSSIGNKLYWLQMAGGGSGTWLWLDDASTTRNLTAIRRRAYLAPR